jgi:hypothetical protein
MENVISINNFKLYEPMTVLTDLILAACCIYFFKYLISNNKRNTSSNNWSFFFLFFALSTLFGAFAHGLFQLHEGIGYLFFWLSMQVLSIISLFFAQQATLYSILEDSSLAVLWRRSFLLQLLLALVAIFVFKNFLVIVISNAVTFIPILILNFRKHNKSNKTVSIGIAVSFLTAIVHASKFSLHLFFNHNDIAHLFLTISLFLVFTGVKQNLNNQKKIFKNN